MTITEAPGPGGWAPVDIVKWVATAIQLVGYGLTGLGATPWNVWAFFGGILFDNYAHYDGLEVVDLAGGVRRVRSVSPERQT